MSKEDKKRALSFSISKWYGYIFSMMFVLYGAVKIILGVLDRDYSDIFQPFIFLLIGVILFNICFAFREAKSWGWYGLVGLNSLVILLALFGLSDSLNVIVGVLSVLALVALLAPQTKTEIFGSH